MNDFEEVKFAPGERLFTAGDVADKLYLIVKGTVQMLDAKSSQPFADLKEGESLGSKPCCLAA